MKFNKAAMFGLDARIALAIFGALSVISGAALYSAIQQAKAEQYRQYFESITKASEQYYLDNGKPLPEHTSGHNIYTADLVTNRESLSTWNGPYLQTNSNGGMNFRDSITASIGSTVYMYAYLEKISTWPSDRRCATNDADCAEYYSLYSTADADAKAALEKVFNMLDDLVDNGDGALDGKVRSVSASNNTYHVNYQGIMRKRTN